jgi:hypothetical protein
MGRHPAARTGHTNRRPKRHQRRQQRRDPGRQGSRVHRQVRHQGSRDRQHHRPAHPKHQRPRASAHPRPSAPDDQHVLGTGRPALSTPTSACASGRTCLATAATSSPSPAVTPQRSPHCVRSAPTTRPPSTASATASPTQPPTSSPNHTGNSSAAAIAKVRQCGQKMPVSESEQHAPSTGAAITPGLHGVTVVRPRAGALRALHADPAPAPALIGSHPGKHQTG